MGQAASRNSSPFVQTVSKTAQRRCAAKPRYVEDRGFALTTIYRVGAAQLDFYPPEVYSLQQAREDIRACAAGAALPHSKRVVRFDRLVGKGGDPRQYALIRFHGYSPADFRDPRLLQLLPYSKKDAQIDISQFAKTGKPYYTVIRHLSQVLDPKRGTVRNWRSRGFDDKYKYDAYNPEAPSRPLGSRVGRRFDASKYPRVRGAGGQWVRMVPCSEAPAMCKPGNTTFPYLNSDDKSSAAAQVLEAKKRKIQLQRARDQHGREMQKLAQRMKGLDRESDQYKRLAEKRQKLRDGLAARVRKLG